MFAGDMENPPALQGGEVEFLAVTKNTRPRGVAHVTPDATLHFDQEVVTSKVKAELASRDGAEFLKEGNPG